MSATRGEPRRRPSVGGLHVSSRVEKKPQALPPVADSGSNGQEPATEVPLPEVGLQERIYIPVPTMGVPGKLYGLRRKRGKDANVPFVNRGDYATPNFFGKAGIKFGKLDPERPQLSVVEVRAIREMQAELDAQWLQAIKDYRRDIAWRTAVALNDKVPRQTVSFACTAGGAATTTSSVFCSAMRGFTTRCIVVFADYNLANGNGAKLHGRGKKSQTTITQRELLKIVKRMQRDDDDEASAGKIEFSDFVSHLRPTEYNVRVVASDSIVEKDQNLSANEAEALLTALEGTSEFRYLDTLNKITDAPAIRCFDHSDVIVFTANAQDLKTLQQLGTSMETLRCQEFRDKVNHSPVIISNIPEGKTADDYRLFLHQVDEDNDVIARTGDQHEGPVLGVPHDPFIARNGVIDLGALAWETFQAWLMVDIAIYRADKLFWNNPSAARNLDLGKVGQEPVQETFEGFEFFELPLTKTTQSAAA